MRRAAPILLLALEAAVALAVLDLLIIDELRPYYLAASVCAVAAAAAVQAAFALRRTFSAADDKGAARASLAALEILRARREVRDRVPKNVPRRESKAAADGSARITTARSMATMIRRAKLREVVIDICDLGDMILETIRRMPHDTPAAVTFCETHLAKLNETLDKCFEISRSDDYKRAPELIERQEIECFAAFVLAFHRQQCSILFEGLLARHGLTT